MCTKTYLHSQRRYRNFYCTVPNSRKEHTCSNATFSCKSQEKISVGDRRGKIWHCRFFWTTASVLASEPEESQIAESVASMASKSGTDARSEQGQTRRLTLHLQVHLAHLGEAVPQVHWKLLNHCQRESPSEGRGQRRKYAHTSLRACVRRGGSREPAAHSEAASYREKETSPASPSLPPSRQPVHSRPRPPAGSPSRARQRRPLTFQIVL